MMEDLRNTYPNFYPIEKWHKLISISDSALDWLLLAAVKSKELDVSTIIVYLYVSISTNVPMVNDKI